MSPKPKRLLSQAACRELEHKLQELEKTKPTPGHYDVWKAGKGKLVTRSVKDAIKKLRVTHRSLADIDADSVRKSLKAFYPKMNETKVALVVDGLVASVSIFSSIQSLETARTIAGAIKTHRSGKISELRDQLAQIAKLVPAELGKCHADVSTYDVFFGDLLSATLKLDVRESARFRESEHKLLEDLLQKLEPSPPLSGKPKLVRRNSADRPEKQQRKAHRREQAKSMPEGLTPLPLTLLGGSVEQRKELAVEKAGLKSAAALLMPVEQSDIDVSDPSTTVSASSQQVTPRVPVPQASASSSTASTPSPSPAAPTSTQAPKSPRSPATPRTLLRVPTSGIKAANGTDASTSANKGTEAKPKAVHRTGHQRSQSEAVASTRRNWLDTMSQAAIKRLMLAAMEKGVNHDAFVTWYGDTAETAWNGILDVVAALDANNDSMDLQWSEVVKNAKLGTKDSKDKRDAIVAASKLLHPTHSELPESISTLLGKVADVIESQRALKKQQ